MALFVATTESHTACKCILSMRYGRQSAYGFTASAFSSQISTLSLDTGVLRATAKNAKHARSGRQGRSKNEEYSHQV